ncbi:MAG: GatB/YqeY domain-containing protein [Paludibacter sp.]|nr:GatB/YqeY domain-containing protein [Paludibacter sp.]MDD4199600.1 GatB/YqeY domain-containing protein [Paludibacter sp.]MDD4429627.1 GatB/YqeY domain-containing protein [Paludibacter sp.]
MEQLFNQISEDIKKAMLARDKVVLEALRGIKKEFLEAKTAKGGDGTLPDEQAVKILQKMVKQRKDSARIFTEQKRQDLADNELAEVAVIEQYLPTQMSDAELESIVAAIIADVGAAGLQDMGKVMGVATRQLAGKAEGRAISEKVKALLTKSC